MVDQAARARASGRDPHPHPPDQVHHFRHGEEIAGEPHAGDGAQLLLQSLPCRHRPSVGTAVAPVVQPRLAALRQDRLRGGVLGRDIARTRRHRVAGQQDLQFRDEHLAHPQVRPRIDPARLPQRDGALQQQGGRSPIAAGAGHDLVSHLRHLGPALESALSVGPIQVAAVQRDQAAHRVQHIHHRGAAPVHIADRVGEHGGQPPRRRPAVHPRRPRGRERHRAGAAVVVLCAVGGHRYHRASRVQRLLPAPHRLIRQILPPTAQRPPHLRFRTEQRHQAGAVLGDLPHRHPRLVALAGQVRGRDQPAQRRPPGGPPGKQHHPWQRWLQPVAAAGRGPPLHSRGAAPRGRIGHRFHREVDPQDGGHPGLGAGADEPHRAVDAVSIGQRQGVLPHSRRGGRQRIRRVSAVAHRVAGNGG